MPSKLTILVVVLFAFQTRFGRPAPFCRRRTEFRCASGNACISKDWLCDGVHDCRDRSDEDEQMCRRRAGRDEQRRQLGSAHYRPYPLRCPAIWFGCRDGLSCVHPLDVCNGRLDCADASDEGAFCLAPPFSNSQNRTDEPPTV